jgi:hypothetical protein
VIVDPTVRVGEKYQYGIVCLEITDRDGKEKVKFTVCCPAGNFCVTECAEQGRFKSQSSHSARFGLD